MENFGSWPDPLRLSELTNAGGINSRYPFLWWLSSMKLIKALSNLAPSPMRVIKRLFEILEVRFVSNKFKSSPISQWLFLFFFFIGFPHFLSSTFWLSSFPVGVFLLGKFGNFEISSIISLFKSLLICSILEISNFKLFPFFLSSFISISDELFWLW